MKAARTHRVTLDELHDLARSLWTGLPAGGVVWLSGDLGSGKTAFVQALTRVVGAEPARSPTYALVHEYPSPHGLLIHVDCYRLQDAEEARDLDFADLIRRARCLIIEWPERAGDHAPQPDVRLTLAYADQPSVRSVEVCS